MLKVRNKTQQPLLIHRGKASPLNLLAGAVAVLEDEEADSPQVQTLIASGLLDAKPFQARTAEGALRERRAAGGRRHGEAGESTTKKTED